MFLSFWGVCTHFLYQYLLALNGVESIWVYSYIVCVCVCVRERGRAVKTLNESINRIK